MAHDFLSQILILLAGSLLVLSLVRRFKLPPILGYLLVGMVLGPHALGLVPSVTSVQVLAEIGVVFLVFTLGLEFSLGRMVAMKSEVLGIEPDKVLLRLVENEMALENDAVIVSAGGVLPSDFLRAAGIEADTKYGTA